jgi:hypothetical protein
MAEVIEFKPRPRYAPEKMDIWLCGHCKGQEWLLSMDFHVYCANCLRECTLTTQLVEKDK